MSDKPIIFSADSVRAILEGRKTQTRRIVKPQPHHDENGLIWWNWSKHCGSACNNPVGVPDPRWLNMAPYAVGQRLWVRERAAFYWGTWHYFADGPREWGPDRTDK